MSDTSKKEEEEKEEKEGEEKKEEDPEEKKEEKEEKKDEPVMRLLLVSEVLSELVACLHAWQTPASTTTTTTTVTLVSGSEDGYLYVRDFNEAGEQQSHFKLNIGTAIHCVAAKNGGVVVCGGADGALYTVDIQNRRDVNPRPTKTQAHSARVTSVAFAPGENLGLVSGSDDGSAKLWHLTNGTLSPTTTSPTTSTMSAPTLGTCLATLDALEGQVLCVRFSCSDTTTTPTVLITTKNGTWQWSTKEMDEAAGTRTEQVARVLTAHFVCVDVSADGSWCSFGERSDENDNDDDHTSADSMLLFAPDTKFQQRFPLGENDKVQAVSISPSRSWVAIATSTSYCSTLMVWDVNTREQLLYLESYGATCETCISLSWAPDGQLLFAGFSDSVIRVFRVTSDATEQGIPMTEGHELRKTQCMREIADHLHRTLVKPLQSCVVSIEHCAITNAMCLRSEDNGNARRFLVRPSSLVHSVLSGLQLVRPLCVDTCFPVSLEAIGKVGVTEVRSSQFGVSITLNIVADDDLTLSALSALCPLPDSLLAIVIAYTLPIVSEVDLRLFEPKNPSSLVWLEEGVLRTVVEESGSVVEEMEEFCSITQDKSDTQNVQTATKVVVEETTIVTEETRSQAGYKWSPISLAVADLFTHRRERPVIRAPCYETSSRKDIRAHSLSYEPSCPDREKVLVVNTVEAFDRFTNLYKHAEGQRVTINWEKLAQDFGGFQLIDETYSMADDESMHQKCFFSWWDDEYYIDDNVLLFNPELLIVVKWLPLSFLGNLPQLPPWSSCKSSF